MADKTGYKTLKFPAFEHAGFRLPESEIHLIEALDSETSYKMDGKPIPLATRVGLYIVGRDLEFGSGSTDGLHEDVKEAGRVIYRRAQDKTGSGGWHSDAVEFSHGKETPKGVVSPAGSAYAKYLKGIGGFERDQHAWKIKRLPSTLEEYVWLPDDGFIVPTCDGAYHPVTGTPFETIVRRENAVKAWVKQRFSEEQAKKELSYFFRSHSGIAAVRSYSGEHTGPLSFYLPSPPTAWDWEGL